jgi:hypothetical protein
MNLSRLLDLHLSQVGVALTRARNNRYPDVVKEEYQDKLIKLFEKIKNRLETTPPQTDSDIFSVKRKIDFIFKSLEFLNTSTLNQIPYEIVACLDCVMEDWLDADKDKFTIVTSLVSNDDSFSFDTSFFEDEEIFEEINEVYHTEFPCRLVQINLPGAKSRDYMASVVLYHELGHFIDLKYKISISLAFDLAVKANKNLLSAEERAIFDNYLPFYFSPEEGATDINTKFLKVQSHLAEYFCDLFAAQYIGYGSNYYLSYITERENVYSNTHPSTTNRVNVVNDFLDRRGNPLVELFNNTMNGIDSIPSHQRLRIRYEPIQSHDFFELLPVEVKNKQQLHGVFVYGWDIWMSDWKEFAIKNNLSPDSNDFGRKKVYAIINNLIEKSISNYITLEQWKMIQPQALPVA